MDYETICRKIKSLEIQGASAVAKKGMEALELRVKEKKPKNKGKALEILEEARQEISSLRPTEPLLRNGLRFIIQKASKQENLQELIKSLAEANNYFFNLIDEGKRKIGEVGARRIKGTIFTHCHSSTAMEIFRKSKDDIEKIYCTETRPRYQGRLTAQELLDEGFETTMVVDSAARHFMKKIDYVVVGADVITSEGNIINKIGTAAIALAAHEARIPLYVATNLLKFNPLTIEGAVEEIEERSWKEIWKEKPEKLEIRNPAFDITPSNYIDGLITEEGIIPSNMIIHTIRNAFPWVLES